MKIKIIAGLFIFAAVFCLASCGSKENKDNQTEKLKPLTIDISDKRQDGSLTMVDTEGNNYLQFDGIIHIENDGSNGEPIKIVVRMKLKITNSIRGGSVCYIFGIHIHL